MWQFIFNCEMCFAKFKDVSEAAKMVQATGYKFFSWNGKIYFVTSDGRPENTGITNSDIEKAVG